MRLSPRLEPRVTREESVLRIIGEIYDAAVDPQKRRLCPQSIDNLFHSPVAHLLRPGHSGETRRGTPSLKAPQFTRRQAVKRQDGVEFTGENVRLAQILISHLQHARALDHRLTRIEGQRDVAARVIDQLTIGVMLLDQQLKPLLVNRSAERLLVRCNGLVLDAGELRTGNPAITRRLKHLVASVSSMTNTTGTPDAALNIPRPSGRKPLRLLVTPAAGWSGQTRHTKRALVAVFVTDPEQTAVSSTVALQRRYGLTPVEAKVTLAIAKGQRVTEIAASLRLTRNTTRWYVKQALAKTGASTQAQLVQVVLNPSPALR
jgi:DNA-binding CsgD family transcriptional regulator